MEYTSTFKDKKILVTGGAGAIGSNLVAALAKAGAKEVIVIDDLSSAEMWNIPDLPRVSFVEGSILDEEKLKYVFLKEPEIVYHLAALFANQNSIENPQKDLLVNGLGTLKVLQYSKLVGSERVVYASSGSSFYEKSSPLPLREDGLSLELDTPYQITKMLGELYCNFFGSFHEIPTVRARFFNSYGPGEMPGRFRNVIPNFIYWALSGEPLVIMGNGESTRDWTYIDDIVDGLLRAGVMKEALGHAMNLASGKETQVMEMAKIINELTGNTAGFRHIPMRKWDSKDRRWGSIDIASELIGYEPKMELAVGIEKTVAWFRDNWGRLQGSFRVK